jgi:lysophospholipase L1-like esterase
MSDPDGTGGAVGLRRAALLGARVMALAVAVTGTQAHQAQRRYGRLASEGCAVDLEVTVTPVGPSLARLPPVEMATFGDSGMVGVGVERAAESLPVQLAQRVADELGRSVHVVGYARSGARTTDVLAEQVPQAARGVHISVLMVGTNDVTHLTSPRHLARSSAALLDALLALGAPVAMASLPEFRAMGALPRPLVDAAAAWADVARRIQEHAARRRADVELVDVRQAVGSEFVRDPRTMSADAFHPSAAGYDLIAGSLAPAVLRAL